MTSALRKWNALKRPVLEARLLRAKLIDWRLGIDTGWHAGSALKRESRFLDSNHFEAIDYSLARRYLRPLQLRPDDVAFDIGCGTGRILCMLGQTQIRRSVGVEVSPELVQIARKNARQLRTRRSEIEVMLGDAAQMDYSEGTIYVMFNPFGAQTMKEVIDRIHASVKAVPRRIRIGYFYPVHEAVLAECGWLTCIGRDSSPFYRVTAAYYSNS